MSESNQNVLVIEAGKSELHYWKDLWRYRELLFFLSWRDIIIRYKQTAIGIAWSVIRPLLTMVIFTVIFGNLAKLPSHGIPYPILIYAAMLPWQFFSTAFTTVSGSLVTNSNLISKVYFPRLIIPVSTIISGLVDFTISFVMYLLLMIIFKVPFTIKFLTIPFFLLLAILLAIGSGLFICSLNVKYRDFQVIVPFIMQLGLYISPVAYSSTIVPEKWQLLYTLNPMVGVIDGFRWALLGNAPINLSGLFVSIIFTIVLLLLGIKYFRSTEKSFVDVI
jgi:lipopolysaccharide transport system permease protein